jgi:K+-sensing histidine kinase KdpD
VLFWPAVIGAAWFGGMGPAILASTLSVLAVDYFLLGSAWPARPRHA